MSYKTNIKNIRNFNPTSIPKPKQSIKLDRSQNYSLEVGAGTGMHSINYCLENPEKSLIAIERTTEKYKKFSKQILPNNLLAIQADAISWVSHCLWPQSLEKIFILYPNPEPKNPTQRWALMPFMAHLLDCLKWEAQLVMATNIKAYADEAQKYFCEYWNLTLISKQKLNATYNARTLFEKKYLQRNENCWNLVFQKLEF